MGMVMARLPAKGLERLPYYEPKAGKTKPREIALAIPHTNEIPAALPFRKALAKRLMEEGIKASTKTEKGMMKRGWEARHRIDAGFKLESGGMRGEETGGGPLPFGQHAITIMLSMEDRVRRIRLIAECMAAGNDLVVELHAMNPGAYFGAEDVEAGLRRIGNRMLFAPDAVSLINNAFLADRSTLAEDEDVAHAVSGLAGVIGLDMDEVFVEYFRARDRIHLLGGSAAIIELSSETAELPHGHPMYPYYRDVSRSDFESAYCAVVRKSVDMPSEEVEAAAWALGAIEGAG
ncbi:MAG: hypothetical protein PHQ80_02660 [Candidatus ainarchaeum sp.]|nr:hypothetical protein [Candidatus ainarchaeum sp.]